MGYMSYLSIFRWNLPPRGQDWTFTNVHLAGHVNLLLTEHNGNKHYSAITSLETEAAIEFGAVGRTWGVVEG